MADLPRRLPVYLLLDVSGSMAGEPIEAVQQGVTALLADLRNDAQAAPMAWLSVLTFGSTAQQLSPLMDLASFQGPDLQAGGSTALGAGLRLLERCIEREVRQPGPGCKGDWRPLVFLLTDGRPTDPWEDVADRFRQPDGPRIVALAAGQADPAVLNRLTDTVLSLSSLQPDSLRAFFQWVALRQGVGSRE